MLKTLAEWYTDHESGYYGILTGSAGQYNGLSGVFYRLQERWPKIADRLKEQDVSGIVAHLRDIEILEQVDPDPRPRWRIGWLRIQMRNLYLEDAQDCGRVESEL